MKRADVVGQRDGAGGDRRPEKPAMNDVQPVRNAASGPKASRR